MDMNYLSFAPLVAGIAAVGAFWTQAKGFARYLTGFVVLQKTIASPIASPVAYHIRRNYKRAPSGISTIRGMMLQIGNSALTSPVPFDMPNRVGIWYGARGIFVVNANDTNLTLLSLRLVSDPYALVKDAVTEEKQLAETGSSANSSRFYVNRIMGTAGDGESGYRNRHERASSGSILPKEDTTPDESNIWASPKLGVDHSFLYEDTEFMKSKQTTSPMRGLFFPPEVHEVLSKIDQWYAQRQWYQDHSIPWRTGVLLHGPGGTGKSSLARVIAESLGLPLNQFYLNTLTDREFVYEWESMQTPCVVALEDFDTVFHGRESVTIHKSLSFECLLNQISGINSLNGVLLIVTTNHLDKVDPALGQVDAYGRPTRPGRIDHILYMGETTEKQRQDIAQFTLGSWAPDLVASLMSEGHGTTAAQFQSMCVQAALERLAARDSNVVELPRKVAI